MMSDNDEEILTACDRVPLQWPWGRESPWRASSPPCSLWLSWLCAWRDLQFRELMHSHLCHIFSKWSFLDQIKKLGLPSTVFSVNLTVTTPRGFFSWKAILKKFPWYQLDINKSHGHAYDMKRKVCLLINVHRICLGDVQWRNACLHVWPAKDIIDHLWIDWWSLQHQHDELGRYHGLYSATPTSKCLYVINTKWPHSNNSFWEGGSVMSLVNIKLNFPNKFMDAILTHK